METQQLSLLHADQDWLERAYEVLAQMAKTGGRFTSLDLEAVIGATPAGTSKNVMGTIFRHASHAGLIRSVGFEESPKASRRGGVVRVWVGA